MVCSSDGSCTISRQNLQQGIGWGFVACEGRRMPLGNLGIKMDGGKSGQKKQCSASFRVVNVGVWHHAIASSLEEMVFGHLFGGDVRSGAISVI